MASITSSLALVLPSISVFPHIHIDSILPLVAFARSPWLSLRSTALSPWKIYVDSVRTRNGTVNKRKFDLSSSSPPCYPSQRIVWSADGLLHVELIFAMRLYASVTRHVPYWKEGRKDE